MKIREILLEYNKDYLKSNFKKKYEQKRNNDRSLSNDVSFNEFLEKIESPLKQQNKFQIIDPYMKWIVEKYVNDGIRYFEDIHSKTIPALLAYDSLKRKNKLKSKHKDITKIKSLNDLLDILDGYSEEDIKSKKEQEKDIEKEFYESGEAELLYNDSEIKVVIPKTERASCYFGRNTRWCTAATKDRNMFSEYVKHGDLYIVLIKKNNERYQFHFESEQFMNERDEPVNPNQLAKKYPKLYDIFGPIAKKHYLLYFQKDIDNLDEEFLIKTVEKNPKNIKNIKNPSENIQIAAIRNDWRSLDYIENPTEKAQLEAVKIDGRALQYINDPSERVQLEAVRNNGNAIYYIKNPSEKIQLEAVKNNGKAIWHIKNPSERVQLEAVKNDAYSIYYIDNPSKKVQMAAVLQNPKAIEYIENPSEEVQLEAVKQDPKVIKYIKNPTPKVLELVQRLKNENP